MTTLKIHIKNDNYNKKYNAKNVSFKNILNDDLIMIENDEGASTWHKCEDIESVIIN